MYLTDMALTVTKYYFHSIAFLFLFSKGDIFQATKIAITRYWVMCMHSMRLSISIGTGYMARLFTA